MYPLGIHDPDVSDIDRLHRWDTLVPRTDRRPTFAGHNRGLMSPETEPSSGPQCARCLKLEARPIEAGSPIGPVAWAPVLPNL